MLDLYTMEVFLAAAETGSFSEAGRRMQLSQPAISMQIRSLENNLGVELFYRAGRHIHLSEIGHALVPLARDLVNHAAQIEETVTSLRGQVTGQLRIANGATAGRYLLPGLIARFLEEHPAVRVNCQMVGRETALQLVLEGEAQLGISSLCEPSKDLEYSPFLADPIVLVAPPGHEWALRGAINPADLPNGKFIQRERDCGLQHTIQQALSAHGISIRDLPTVMEMGDPEAVCRGVTEGIGAAFVSRRVAAGEIAAGRVVEVPVQGLDLYEQLYLVRRSGESPSSIQTLFWEFIASAGSRDLLCCERA